MLRPAERSFSADDRSAGHAVRWLPAVLVTTVLAAATATTVWGVPLRPGSSVWMGLCAGAGASILRPGASAAVIGALMVIAVADPSLPVGMSVLATLVAVGSLAAQRPLTWALGAAIVYAAILVMATVEVARTPGDALVGIAIWTLCLGGALAVGLRIRRALRDVQAARARRHDELEDQRRALARELHDSAVRATSQIVLMAETARRAEGVDPRADEALAAISDRARGATQEILVFMEDLRRALEPEDSDLGVTSPDHAPSPLTALPPRTWADLIARERERLAAAGFRTEVSIEGDVVPPAGLLPTLGHCVDEFVSNIQRHGDPAEGVAVLVDTRARRLELVMTNGHRRDAIAIPRHGEGLETARSHLLRIGGSLSVRDDGQRFAVHLSIPTTGEAP